MKKERKIGHIVVLLIIATSLNSYPLKLVVINKAPKKGQDDLFLKVKYFE